MITFRKTQMRIQLPLLLILTTLSGIAAQNVPIDFEPDGNGADWTWTTFENGSNPPLEIIANPDPAGINTSATVAKFTALQVGQPFAGCESMQGADIGTFTIDEDNAIIRIMVWKSVISDVGIKLVEADFASLGEIKIPNTTVGEWEQLEFDFSAHMGATYTQIVIFPDFADRNADNIIYFDNVYGPSATTSSTTNVNDREKLSFFPNPVDHTLTVLADQNINNYTIYSASGQEVIRYRGNAPVSTINTTELQPGLYVLRTIIDGQQLAERFIKL